MEDLAAMRRDEGGDEESSSAASPNPMLSQNTVIVVDERHSSGDGGDDDDNGAEESVWASLGPSSQPYTPMSQASMESPMQATVEGEHLRTDSHASNDDQIPSRLSLGESLTPPVLSAADPFAFFEEGVRSESSDDESEPDEEIRGVAQQEALLMTQALAVSQRAAVESDCFDTLDDGRVLDDAIQGFEYNEHKNNRIEEHRLNVVDGVGDSEGSDGGECKDDTIAFTVPQIDGHWDDEDADGDIAVPDESNKKTHPKKRRMHKLAMSEKPVEDLANSSHRHQSSLVGLRRDNSTSNAGGRSSRSRRGSSESTLSRRSRNSVSTDSNCPLQSQWTSAVLAASPPRNMRQMPRNYHEGRPEPEDQNPDTPAPLEDDIYDFIDPIPRRSSLSSYSSSVPSFVCSDSTPQRRKPKSLVNRRVVKDGIIGTVAAGSPAGGYTVIFEDDYTQRVTHAEVLPWIVSSKRQKFAATSHRNFCVTLNDNDGSLLPSHAGALERISYPAAVSTSKNRNLLEADFDTSAHPFARRTAATTTHASMRIPETLEISNNIDVGNNMEDVEDVEETVASMECGQKYAAGDDTLCGWVGVRVSKPFSGKHYAGTVVKIWPADPPEQKSPLYLVRYDDGDTEDMPVRQMLWLRLVWWFGLDGGGVGVGGHCFAEIADLFHRNIDELSRFALPPNPGAPQINGLGTSDSRDFSGSVSSATGGHSPQTTPRARLEHSLSDSAPEKMEPCPCDSDGIKTHATPKPEVAFRQPGISSAKSEEGETYVGKGKKFNLAKKEKISPVRMLLPPLEASPNAMEIDLVSPPSSPLHFESSSKDAKIKPNAGCSLESSPDATENSSLSKKALRQVRFVHRSKSVIKCVEGGTKEASGTGTVIVTESFSKRHSKVMEVDPSGAIDCHENDGNFKNDFVSQKSNATLVAEDGVAENSNGDFGPVRFHDVPRRCLRYVYAPGVPPLSLSMGNNSLAGAAGGLGASHRRRTVEPSQISAPVSSASDTQGSQGRGYAHRSVRGSQENAHVTMLVFEVNARSRGARVDNSAASAVPGRPQSLYPHFEQDEVRAISYILRDDDSDQAAGAVKGAVVQDSLRGAGDVCGVIYVKSTTTTGSSMSVAEAAKLLLAPELQLPPCVIDFGAVGAGLRRPKGARVQCPTEVRVVNSEAELFVVFAALVRATDPDILMGFEMQRGALGYLLSRAKVLGLPLPRALSRSVWGQQNGRHGGDSLGFDAQQMTEFWLPGRHVLNLWRIIRKADEKLHNYSLEHIALRCLKRRVARHSGGSLESWWREPTERWRVLRYLLCRTQVTLALVDHFDIVGRHTLLAQLFGADFFCTFTRGSQYRVESTMLRVARDREFVLFSASTEQRQSSPPLDEIALNLEPGLDVNNLDDVTKGAFVARATVVKAVPRTLKYFCDPVVVLDFRSLYPSIIIAYNLCFSTLVGRLRRAGDRAGSGWRTRIGARCPYQPPPAALPTASAADELMVSQIGTVFVPPNVHEGILPVMLREILATRVMIKKELKRARADNDKVLARVLDNRQYGLKMIANVTYGYTSASFSGRMPCADLADTIVRLARETLMRAIRLVESTAEWSPARVVYGDTDSLFVYLKGRTRGEAFRIGREIAARVTATEPGDVELQFEKIYHPLLLSAKKRYVGMSFESEEEARTPGARGHFDAKGIETVRRDGCALVRKVLETSLRTLFASNDIEKVKALVQRQFTRILAGHYSVRDFIFFGQLNRDNLDKYRTPVYHVMLAKQQLARDPGRRPLYKERIPYVLVAGPKGVPNNELVRDPYELVNRGVVVHAQFYILNALAKPLDRMWQAFFGDPKLSLTPGWVRWMHRPRSRILRASTTAGPISRYLALPCALCGGLSGRNSERHAVCENCAADPQRLALVAANKLRGVVSRAVELSRICRQCSTEGAARTVPGVGEVKLLLEDVVTCVNLDCGIFYQRRKAFSHVMHLNELQHDIDRAEARHQAAEEDINAAKAARFCW